MCAVNQDAMEAMKDTGETDSLIGVLGETDSHQVRRGALLQFVPWSLLPFYFLLSLLEVISFLRKCTFWYSKLKIHVSLQWSSNWFTEDTHEINLVF